MADKESILIVDDDAGMVNLMQTILAREGYRVDTAFSGDQAYDKVLASPPDLILSDVEMPYMDGFELTKKISEDPALRKIPVILMSAQRVSSQDRVTGLGAGGDDYMLKPFTPQELLARVRAVLRRKEIGLDANPLTRLPGNTSILRVIERRLEDKAPFAVLYADLNHFKGYNDRYGFLKGDEVLLFTARVLEGVVQSVTQNKTFLGHIGGDDFVLIGDPDQAVPVCEAVIQAFDRGVSHFYSEEDRKRGYIETVDRLGHPIKYPVMGIAIAVVSNRHREITQVGQISQIGAELKHFAKAQGVSCYVTDRRTDNRKA